MVCITPLCAIWVAQKHRPVHQTSNLFLPNHHQLVAISICDGEVKRIVLHSVLSLISMMPNVQPNEQVSTRTGYTIKVGHSDSSQLCGMEITKYITVFLAFLPISLSQLLISTSGGKVVVSPSRSKGYQFGWRSRGSTSDSY